MATFLAESIKSGKIKVCQADVEALEITAVDKKIDVNAKDKEFVRDLISTVRKGNQKSKMFGPLGRGFTHLRTAREVQPMVKDIAEDLCRAGLTVTLSFKGDPVVTMGFKADPKFTHLLSGTKDIEINSVKKLFEIGL